jgi:hypothetical protein
MKVKFTLFLNLCIAASFFVLQVYSQEKIVETKYFKNNPDLGEDVLINSSTKEVIGDKSYTTFEIEAKAGGSYALSLWVTPVLYPDGNYSSFDVYVNGTKISEQVKFAKGNWQAVALSKKVNIEKGINIEGCGNKLSVFWSRFYYTTRSFNAGQVVSVSAVTPNNDQLIIEIFSSSLLPFLLRSGKKKSRR